MRRLALPSLALLAVVALAACGGGATPSPSQAAASQPPAAPPSASGPATACAETTDPASVDVEIAGSAFDPQTVQAAVGDVVGWTNSDGVPHSAVVASAGCETATLRQGDTGALTFSVAGTYGYVCGIHPNMTGTVEVSG